MVLHINTKDQKKVEVKLGYKGKVISEMSQEREYGSQVLLPLILKLLKTTHPSSGGNNLKTIQAIEVETGPGSFTGLRVGVTVANALGYCLGIKVNGKKLETELLY